MDATQEFPEPADFGICDKSYMLEYYLCEHVAIGKGPFIYRKLFCFTALCWLPNVYKVKMSTEKTIREDQVEILEYNFTRISKNPDRATLDLIAAEAGLSVEEVLDWFKKRLGEWRKSEGLPSESRSVRD